MIAVAAWLGAALSIVIISSIIEHFRRKTGGTNPPGSALWSIWISLALYGAGSRQDYRFENALAYIVCGLALWAYYRYRTTATVK